MKLRIGDPVRRPKERPLGEVVQILGTSVIVKWPSGQWSKHRESEVQGILRHRDGL